jgi:hypothetical protein
MQARDRMVAARWKSRHFAKGAHTLARGWLAPAWGAV